MGFTTPCFIRKNTEELRKKLEELGYNLLNSGDTTLDAHNYDGKGSHKNIEEGRAIITSYGNLYGVIYNVDAVTKKGRSDCGTNEELFLAIAALRDDSNYMQWFICTEDYIESPAKEWKVGDWDLNTCPDVTYEQQLPHWRKATVEELINHFK
ncbi:hypothetical protein O1504_13660 [Bacteroides fragilis]|uniref:hypothetical protein n=1 Tax=Bacteroides fragilis TaxID=817 RepID=UPI002161639D|nr:hypothetical protein [Bacteroides fragilis]MCZ2590845.1 hypothetical protein [Bacteroides fragilis]UVO59145.1 hypothetical protein NXW10_13185 [Bacteroides fragilis]